METFASVLLDLGCTRLIVQAAVDGALRLLILLVDVCVAAAMLSDGPGLELLLRALVEHLGEVAVSVDPSNLLDSLSRIVDGRVPDVPGVTHAFLFV